MATASPSFDPERFAGRSVLDVGAFDGFYSFLAERRGASRVVAVDNEQYVDWVAARFGVKLAPATGFHAIAQVTGSQVEYHRMDGFAVGDLKERFDVVLCFGILHRVTDPIAFLQTLADVLAPIRPALPRGRSRRQWRGRRETPGDLHTRSGRSR